MSSCCHVDPKAFSHPPLDLCKLLDTCIKCKDLHEIFFFRKSCFRNVMISVIVSCQDGLSRGLYVGNIQRVLKVWPIRKLTQMQSFLCKSPKQTQTRNHLHCHPMNLTDCLETVFFSHWVMKVNTTIWLALVMCWLSKIKCYLFQTSVYLNYSIYMYCWKCMIFYQIACC